jgi:hypothetical protein
MMSTIISHAKVKMGNAHHTRRDAFGEAGGGGGGSTLVGAVGLVLLLSASMTVTEVTTRIALVGILCFSTLLLIGRVGRKTSSNISVSSQHIRTTESVDLEVSSRHIPSVFFMVVLSVVVGLALGLIISLGLLVILRTSGTGIG